MILSLHEIPRTILLRDTWSTQKEPEACVGRVFKPVKRVSVGVSLRVRWKETTLIVVIVSIKYFDVRRNICWFNDCKEWFNSSHFEPKLWKTVLPNDLRGQLSMKLHTSEWRNQEFFREYFSRRKFTKNCFSEDENYSTFVKEQIFLLVIHVLLLHQLNPLRRFWAILKSLGELNVAWISGAVKKMVEFRAFDHHRHAFKEMKWHLMNKVFCASFRWSEQEN